MLLFTLGPIFTLVDSNGDTSQEGELALLLYRGGTVCNPYYDFDITAGNAICHLMG
jgi:hypothetical protein